jgi:hypothetical protein
MGFEIEQFEIVLTSCPFCGKATLAGDSLIECGNTEDKMILGCGAWFMVHSCGFSRKINDAEMAEIKAHSKFQEWRRSQEEHHLAAGRWG